MFPTDEREVRQPSGPAALTPANILAALTDMTTGITDGSSPEAPEPATGVADAAGSAEATESADAAESLSAVDPVDTADAVDAAHAKEATDAAASIDLIRLLERIKSVASAVQMVETLRVDALQTSAAAVPDAGARERADTHADADVTTSADPVTRAPALIEAQRRGEADPHARSVGAQVGMARRESPTRGRRFLGVSRAIVQEMPCTWAALCAGRIDEYRAQLLVEATAGLSREDRARLDQEVAGDAERLERLSIGRLRSRATAVAGRLDPAAMAARRRIAETNRRVSLRPLPDTMAGFSAVLPAVAGVACLAALRRSVRERIGLGDPRTSAQLHADSLVKALTGHDAHEAAADAEIAEAHAAWESTYMGAAGGGDERRHENTANADRGAGQDHHADGAVNRAHEYVDNSADKSDPADRGDVRNDPFGVEVRVVISAETLMSLNDRSAWLEGYGPVPADLVRRLASSGGADDPYAATRLWLRRLFTAPESGAVIGMESRRRIFPAGLRDLIRTRDRTCRMPYCDAPIRHIDHVDPVRCDGVTTYANGQGLCERCNYLKETTGWSFHVRDTGRPPDAERITIPGPPRGAPSTSRDTPPTAGGGSSTHTVVVTTPTGHSYDSTAPPVL